MATDFWPAGLGEGMVTPVSILREQAALLGPKTNQLVKAEVVSQAGGESGGLLHLFLIVVPTLDNYKYELFKAYHTVMLYPVSIIYMNTSINLANETLFRQRLGIILGSDSTKQLINALLAQVAR